METQFKLSKEMIGKPVFGSDGKKLGKLSGFERDSFLVEKGFLFPKDYALLCRHISSVATDGLHLDQPAHYFVELYRSGERREAAPEKAKPAEVKSAAGEIRIPVAEERFEVQKSLHETGAVRIKKEVVTEHKTVTVPVQREEVHVERVRVSERPAAAGEATFQQQTISIPVHEEEIEIRKRPVVKEEVRISRRQVQTEQRADADLRREEIEVEPEGNVGPFDHGEGHKLI